MEQLIQAFSLEKINKGGARFDYEKAKWFNQKYIQSTDNKTLAQLMWPYVKAHEYDVCEEYLEQVAALMKERVTFIQDFVDQGQYLFETVATYDMEALSKKWKSSLAPVFERWIAAYEAAQEGTSIEQEEVFKAFVAEQGVKPGEMLPLLRLALAGTMKGPGVFELAATLGKEETLLRLNNFLKFCLTIETA